MKARVPEPERLSELAPTADAAVAEQRAATLLRGIGEPAAVSPELLLRVKSCVLGSAPKRARALRVKLLLAAAISIASSGVVFAAQSSWRAAQRRHEIIVPRGATTHLAEAPQQRMTVIGPARAELGSEENPVPAPDATQASEMLKPSLRNAPDPLARLRESGVLSEALVELRRDHDPRAALARLDQYSQRFPNGSLALEAARARAEALIALGRRADALRVLDGLSPAALGRSMLLVRAELRAEWNRCADALSDFSTALSQNPHDGVDERALFGRATCRSRTADSSGARADLNLYALRFPHGRFQTQVARALQK